MSRRVLCVPVRILSEISPVVPSKTSPVFLPVFTPFVAPPAVLFLAHSVENLRELQKLYCG